LGNFFFALFVFVSTLGKLAAEFVKLGPNATEIGQFDIELGLDWSGIEGGKGRVLFDYQAGVALQPGKAAAFGKTEGNKVGRHVAGVLGH